MDAVKFCAKCHTSKNRSEYNKARKRPDGLQAYCRDCEKSRYRDLSPEQLDAKRHKAREAYLLEVSTEEGRTLRKKRSFESWLWHKARITPDQYVELLATQDNKCGNAGCGVEHPGRTDGWCIDHDHACCPGRRSCGQCVRGLLCHDCNLLLGHARDKVSVLEGAIEYLRKDQ